MSTTLPPKSEPVDTKTETSFAETALKLGGKSEEEARRTGAIDRADDQGEQLFKAQYQTVNSPIHRAVWERTLPVELFEASHESTPPDVQQVMSRSLDVVRRHRAAGTIFNAEDKVSEAVLTDLARVGYWGL